MRATRAYITSFGTTGLLIASAMLMLTVMSAFVAFNGFPGQDVQDPVGTLLMREPQSTVTVPARPVHSHTAPARRSAVGSRHRAARRSDAPVARTGPVRDPAGGTAPAPASTSQPSTSSTPATSPQLPTGGSAPALPDPKLPPAPAITVPSISPPQDSQLPLDTSTVTGTVDGIISGN